MNNLKHVILGSHGIVGTELYSALKHYSNNITLVNRISRGDPQERIADLTDLKQTVNAIHGHDVVYLTAGVTYSASLWAQYWPVITDNVINATLETGARLVFFDNVYMYGKVEGWMTEDTPFNPVSKKGEVRAEIAQKVLDAIAHRNLNALIARSADFYGYSDQSIPNMLVFDKLSKNETPLLLLEGDKKHTYTYTKDIGSSIAFLAQDESNFKQTWHLPTDKNALTASDFARLASESLGKKIPAQILSKEDLEQIAKGDEFVREVIEMLYQNDSDYLFSSQKYENKFKKFPTPYETGARELASLYGKAR